MNLKRILGLALHVLALAPVIAQAAPVDITTLPGYQVVTTSTLNFSDGGWAGWSITGKEVLGASIVSAGDSFSDFSVFRPVGPGTVTPFGYTYGVNEYGFIFRDAINGTNNSGVQIQLYFADPLAGYTITESSSLNYSATGWGGWSAPSGNVVSGGGFAFSNTGASAGSSQFADGGSSWPHYTFGANEQGWVVQNGGTNSSANVYVISFAAPVPEPETYAMMLAGLGLMGFMVRRRKFDD
jgi:hypothetical protein